MKVMLDSGAFAPTRAHKTDAGLDLRSPICIEVPANGSAVIDTGVHVELPNGTVGFLKSKSGLNVKNDITSEGVISQFSKEYYQLIVTAADIFDTDSGSAVSIPTDRALKQHSVPDEIFDRCSSLSDEGIEELKTFPAIICSEKLDRYYADVDAKHMAIFAYIRKIKKCRKEIKIYYTPLQMIPLRILCENPIDYGIDVDCALSDFNVTAWTVHKINLFEAFDDTGIRGVPTPM